LAKVDGPEVVMRKPVILVTGASGEIGHGLIHRVHGEGRSSIITIDLRPLPDELKGQVEHEFIGSILDKNLLDRIVSEYEVDTVFHLAALLSTRSEFTPLTAHQVNVEGTLNLLHFAQSQGESHGRPTVFLYPSSIAAYGLPDLETKERAGRVKEHEWNQPATMYGCNKLYCEQLGRYFTRFYKQLAADSLHGKVDFRAIRLPGLISTVTAAPGDTSSYAQEMVHAAARGECHACFVRPDTRIPFMVMHDAVDALMTLSGADAATLGQRVYNVTAFNPSAEEIRQLVMDGFPEAEISFEPDPKRQAIVDSWPADVDDSAARTDWGLDPHFDLDRAFDQYLIPRIRERYSG
jgi:nucleoside-diphosphate-sugar epimerase